MPVCVYSMTEATNLNNPGTGVEVRDRGTEARKQEWTSAETGSAKQCGGTTGSWDQGTGDSGQRSIVGGQERREAVGFFT